MVREDLIISAVSFLQDPSVAAAPIEQRTAFLRSKNLTQEEIDLSLQRAGSESAPYSAPSQPTQSYQQSQQYPPQQQPYNYQNGPAQAYWQQPPPPPPELPRRDWRDWFIMATVLGGVSFGVYTVAKRYIVPLIAPPTPPQLEQDKASIDSQFEKAFALLDQLSTDTDELKQTEKERTEKLDNALGEVESVIGQLKDASKRRDDEGRRLADEVRVLKDMIPRAMESQKDTQEQRLKDLATEMKSLKTLISNRMSAPNPAPAPAPAPTPSAFSARPNPSAASFSPSAATGANGASPAATVAAEASPTSATQQNQPAENGPTAVPSRAGTSSPYGRNMNGRAAIPAWQMAASKKNQEAKEKSATVEPADGPATDSATA